MSKNQKSNPKVVKTDAAWRAQLSEAEYNITRKQGTERAFTGPNWDQKADGCYNCVCCDAPLFSSQAKYDTGTGWPSFYAPLSEQAVAEFDDRRLFSRRTEIRCTNCDAHLGHVFPDGPQPTGLRYCMNGTALTFEGDKS